MATKVLTKAVKEKLVKDAVMDRFVPSLLKHWEVVKAQLTDFVKEEVFKNFDWEHVGPYRDFINWHHQITLLALPAEWRIRHANFRCACGLPDLDYIDLSFEYPSREPYYIDLDGAFQEHACDILRPYMFEYFVAEKCYEDITQVLRGISTYRQLKEIMPELIRYLPEIEIGDVTMLVPIEQINRVRDFWRKKHEEVVNG